MHSSISELPNVIDNIKTYITCSFTMLTIKWYGKYTAESIYVQHKLYVTGYLIKNLKCFWTFMCSCYINKIYHCAIYQYEAYIHYFHYNNMILYNFLVLCITNFLLLKRFLKLLFSVLNKAIKIKNIAPSQVECSGSPCSSHQSAQHWAFWSYCASKSPQ